MSPLPALLRRLLPVTLCSLASLAAAACGGSDSTTAAPVDPADTETAPAQPGPAEPGESSPDGDGPAAGIRPDPCRGVPLPLDQHFVAPGLCASAVAFGQEELRQITFARNGDLIGVRIAGDVVRYRDVDGDGLFEGDAEVVTIADTGGNGNNAHLDEAGGYLYAGSPDGVVRWPYSPDATSLGAPEPVVVNQPSDGTHAYHTVHVYDGWLYVHSGSEGNVVAPMSPEYDTERSLLARFDLSQLGAPFEWAAAEVVATGLRNMVGYTRDPSGNLFGVVNGIDELSYRGQDVRAENPGEPLIQIEAGQAFGYPYCFTAQNISTDSGPVAPGTQLAVEADGFENPHDDAWCQQSSTPPRSFLPAHSAPLDITFYAEPARAAPRALPDAWLGGAFVSLHGSFQTDPSVGHAVVFFPFGAGQPSMPASDRDPPVYPFTVVLGGGSSAGHVDGRWGWSSGDRGEERVRPVGVAVSPLDGALYISSDGDGVLYRVGVPL